MTCPGSCPCLGDFDGSSTAARSTPIVHASPVRAGTTAGRALRVVQHGAGGRAFAPAGAGPAPAALLLRRLRDPLRRAGGCPVSPGSAPGRVLGGRPPDGGP